MKQRRPTCTALIMCLVAGCGEIGDDPAEFGVVNGCSHPVEFRLTDDEMIGPNWWLLLPDEALRLTADASPVDEFWFEVRTVGASASMTYQPKTAAVEFAGAQCSSDGGASAPSTEVVSVERWTGLQVHDQRAIEIDFVGAPLFDWDDPCSRRYEASVHETSSDVTISLVGRAPDIGDQTAGCASAVPRTLRIELAGPLIGRRIVDAATAREWLLDHNS